MLKMSLNQLVKNLSLLVNVVEDAEADVSAGDCEDKTGGRLPRSKHSSRAGYLTSKARLTFTYLRQAFTKAAILRHFDLECHIRIKTNVLSYAISRVLSQLTLDNLGWWHPIAYFFQKMIPAKTRYKIYNGKLLAIVETFKTLKHYLEGYKHKVLVLINHNNL